MAHKIYDPETQEARIFHEADCDLKRLNGKTVAVIGKELFRLTDTYTIEAAEKNILRALMVVLAIDAEKCSAR